MIRGLFKKIHTFIYSFFWGLRGADRTMLGTADESLYGGMTIGQQNEQNSVYKDLLRGEVTQEVKELRHEMYYSERASHKYKYVGNGVVTKKNDLFGYTGKIEESDGYPLQVLQPNVEDLGTLTENMSESDYRLKNKKEFTIDIERDFLPRFRLEEFTSKLVVKRVNETAVILDFYTPIYQQQFNKRHKAFLSDLDNIYQGDTRSDTIDFDKVHFISFRAFGTDDLKEYEYENIEFDNILQFDGDYVIRFTADVVKDGDDIIQEFFCKEEDEKSRNHEARNNKGATVDFTTVLMKQNDTYDYDKAGELMDKV